jgi:type I restriction enzyme, S subunit
MSKQFPLVPLGEVLRHSQEYIEAPEFKVYPKLSVKLYGKGVTLDTPADGSSLKMKRHQLAKSGQVILSEIWGKKGAIGFVPSEGEGALCTSHFFLFDVIKEKIEPKYLQMIFAANYLESQLDEQAKGTTGYAAVRPKYLLAAKIPLPPLEEQQRIVARIESLAANIEEARGLREKAVVGAEAIIPAVMHGKFDFDGSETTVGDFATVQGGFAFASESYDEKGTHQVVRIGNVRDGYLDLTRALVRWNPASDKRVLKYELNPGDLVISMTGTREKRDYGFIAIVPDNHLLLLNQRVGRFVIHREIDHNYLFQFLRSPFFRDRLFPSATGTANQANIGNGDIERINFAPPPLSEQQQIVADLEVLQAKIDQLKCLQAETSKELDAILPSVLDKAFKGKL